jgi:hypothetical protein
MKNRIIGEEQSTNLNRLISLDFILATYISESDCTKSFSDTKVSSSYYHDNDYAIGFSPILISRILTMKDQHDK